MKSKIRASWLVLVLFSVVFTACATAGGEAAAGGGDAAATGTTTLRVHNTDTSGQTLTIFLVPLAGAHIQLGTVRPNEYFTIAHTAGEGRFQLRAQRPDGTSRTSPAFNVVSGTYTWDMSLNRVDRAR
jgi:hypothetical protein